MIKYEYTTVMIAQCINVNSTNQNSKPADYVNLSTCAVAQRKIHTFSDLIWVTPISVQGDGLLQEAIHQVQEPRILLILESLFVLHDVQGLRELSVYSDHPFL